MGKRIKEVGLGVGKLVIFASTFVVGLSIDQLTKHWVLSNFRWGESRAVIDSVFALTYVRNSGAAFGMLHDAPPAFRDPFFLVIPLVICAVIASMLYKLPPSQRLSAFGLSLVITGAIGNLIDRLRFGYVVDFIDVHWHELYHWPAFNIADSCIVVGVAILFTLSLLRSKQTSS